MTPRVFIATLGLEPQVVTVALCLLLDKEQNKLRRPVARRMNHKLPSVTKM